jgi:glycosyltransferase involved in cell wall biosynthesis
VIAMDLGSCREVIDDGVTGFLVRDPVGAARCLAQVPQIERSACRQRVKQCFSVDTMVQQYERVYSTILEREARQMV